MLVLGFLLASRHEIAVQCGAGGRVQRHHPGLTELAGRDVDHHQIHRPGLPAASGDATSKSAVSRRFVALTRSKLKAWLASPLDDLDLVVLQIDGLHVGDHLMVAAIGIDTGGAKHVLGLAEGATENAATVQAMLDNLIERGLDPERPRLYIVDGAKALSKAIRRTFGRAAALQRCQVHKGRNITDRLDESLHAGVRKVLRQEGGTVCEPCRVARCDRERKQYAARRAAGLCGRCGTPAPSDASYCDRCARSAAKRSRKKRRMQEAASATSSGGYEDFV